MLEELLSFEKDYFLAVNGSDSVFWNHFMWIMSDKLIWAPIAVFMLALLVYKQSWKKWLPMFIAIAVLFVLCDQFSSGICKPLFTRFRPTRHPEFMNEVKTLYGYMGGGKYGFISGHACNSFGFATLMTLLLRGKWFTITIFSWASIVAFSRVYLGVHFISDVVAGAFSGIIIGILVYYLYRFYQKSVYKENPIPAELSTQRVNIMAGAMLSYILILTIFNRQVVEMIK
ncbi:phosphatase PAP2 family protein [Bacteroidales bacterium OttesenSCG-928-M11]|nr:phosphatase PAP2 family protein [Bacteroidales bacterium OttesenSCG-928-M11]